MPAEKLKLKYRNMKTHLNFEKAAPGKSFNNEQDEILRGNDPLNATDRILYLLLVFLITTSFLLL